MTKPKKESSGLVGKRKGTEREQGFVCYQSSTELRNPGEAE